MKFTIDLTGDQKAMIQKLKKELYKTKLTSDQLIPPGVSIFENFELVNYDPSIFENFSKIEYKPLIFEVSSYRSEILKDIDDLFSRLKKDNKDLAAKKELVEKLKEFTGIKHIILTIKSDYLNAAVMPIYNKVISADLFDIFKDYEVGKDIRNIEVVDEPSKYITKIYIILGKELINEFSPRELTSILLHEFGHVFTYTSNLPRILLVLFQKTIGVVGTLLKTPILIYFKMFTLPAYLMATLVTILLVRSLTFFEHKGEYKADQFAVKYGYGDELVRVLHKFHIKQIEIEKQQNVFIKILNILNGLLSPSTHPESSRRIEEATEKMMDEYKKLYPKLKTELDIILKDIGK